MRMYDIIEKKKRGYALTREEIRYAIEGYTNGNVPDYQMSALLMAIYFSKMNSEETYELTMAMMESGDLLDLSAIDGIKVDKHSTGGVGDKTTLIIGPIVAALGVPVAKMSGRGLGHTGGTIDKLESIAGFNTSVELNTFMKQVNDIKIAVAGQTAKLAPADKKIYALRDVTATVDNISLIASSIMSKKLASGADAIVLDVKCGKGAFMKDKESACELARTMVDIGKSAGKKMKAIVTDMNEPLGRWIGNSVEVYEAVKALGNIGERKLMEVCNVLASHMLIAAGIARQYDDAIIMVNDAIESGRALDKLAQLVEAQGGDGNNVRKPELLPRGRIIRKVKATRKGCIISLDAELVGKACMSLGGGRETKDGEIDLSVGIYLDKKTGETVEKDEAIATIYGSDEDKVNVAYSVLERAYTIEDNVDLYNNSNENMIIKIID
ncbi:MAG: thymidine phosphorylase [Lachnospiraceae bacterium]|nr:thymidine phosphorylase [Lachnospiraceae bacterium]